MSEKISKFKGITDEFKKEFKSLIERFNIAPVVATPVVTPPVTPEKKFGEATLSDGTIIKWDGDMPLAVGTPVMVIDPTNPQGFLPAPDGDFDLQDGSKISIKDGAISVYTPVAPAPPVTPAPQMNAQFEKIEAELKEVKENFAKVNTEKETLEAKITEMSAQLEANKKNIETISENSKKMFEMFVEAMDTPQENPIETPQSVKKSKKELLIESLHKNK